ncbi:hypothetical protein DPF85_05940 [Limosilactobacillus fermentum]|uniref:hypothetical protein n=1 Tax=Limosilactobacillus fermentum TaxID=1613 RepID=UPI000DC050E7|nr:hypothetical protein [Limosilactobacillus fermentum]RAM09881.1 hypothetical protein DPF85_05940 [Limosilactobacillus fermentum]
MNKLGTEKACFFYLGKVPPEKACFFILLFSLRKACFFYLPVPFKPKAKKACFFYLLNFPEKACFFYFVKALVKPDKTTGLKSHFKQFTKSKFLPKKACFFYLAFIYEKLGSRFKIPAVFHPGGELSFTAHPIG